MKRNIHIYGRLIREALPYWKTAALAMLAMMATAAMEPLLPALMAPLIDESLIDKDPRALIRIPLLIVAVFVFKGLTEYIGSVASQYVANRTVADIRSEVFSVQLDLPMTDHDAEEGGRFLSRITYDVAQVGQAVSTAWMVIIKDSLMIIGLLIFLIYTSWQMSLALLITAPIVAIVIKKASVKMRHSNQSLQIWTGRLTGLIEESLLSVRDIKIFGGHKNQQTRFDHINKRLRHEQMRVIKIQSLNVPLVQILAAITIGGVILIGTQMSARDLLSPGEFVAYITAMGMIFDPVRRLTGVNAIIQRGLAAAESIYEIFDRSLDEQRKFSNTEAALKSASLEIRKACFQYPNNQTKALDLISFRIEPGESVALVGPSGSGKTSLIALIAGFIDPTSGEIRIHEEPVVNWSLSKRRRQLSLVSQQVNLFDGNIADNIRFGNPDATDDEIMEAARQANVLEFIGQFSDGLNTRIGPFGGRLSGGQRQRIAIARALIKGAPILLLDEPTSALDPNSREQVLLGLENLKCDRTTLIISHQPETLLSVDRTIYISSGKLRSESKS
ncbi:ABC transporter transmembrane domain-containing protein [Litorivicinus sp.]|nr:ABC transporter transmembrane domain-containing protein [Litorivicinus sp.]MDC1466532.1 ABC transporter transmembrane domain-containing protein [Litorivicinus sp.]